MNKQTGEQQNQEPKKTFPLDEANKMKQQKNEADGIPARPKDESYKGHQPTP